MEQSMENNTAILTETIKDTVVEILKTGNSAPKLYLRSRPNGTVDVSEETSWCCSPDEYYRRVPHTLSLEVLAGTRDYSSLSESGIEECADNATDAAEEIVANWEPDITAWVMAGNLEGVAATEHPYAAYAQ